MKHGEFMRGYNNFLLVRDRLKNKRGLQEAYNKCFKKPFSFYRTHSVDEAIEIIKKECG